MERFFTDVQLFQKWRSEAPLRTPPRQRHSPADEGVGSTRASARRGRATLRTLPAA